MVNIHHCGSVINSSSTGSVDTTSATILSSNPNRMSAHLVNDGTQPVYLSLNFDSGTAAVGKGIRLNAAGSADSTYRIDSTNLFSGTVNAITGSGTSSVTVLEMATE